MIPYLIIDPEPPYFPDNLKPDRTGLVALGGELSSAILLEAYSKGIFPWSGEYPVPWYSPDPRLVLFPEKLHISETMRKILKKGHFAVSFDTNFEIVIEACSSVIRRNHQGTWIDEKIKKAYSELYRAHNAHSVEIFQDGDLVGGLYGVSLGRIFFGESMFSVASNASKLALIHLAAKLREYGYHMIDCQQVTSHMMSMGAEPLPRKIFLAKLAQGLSMEGRNGFWT
jgi:leucyl/phenylalanyl-tRNA--protein transferase